MLLLALRDRSFVLRSAGPLRLPRPRLGEWRSLQHEVVLADYLHAERAAALVRIVDAAH
jgi:hypothetical protein